ncbi:uncharacterized protein LOC112141232 [Oryzias melastigma]|uniref:uncharacterized protein LOC112141232 n=1 Tax=Oryzias melastigma TaxID=30732 RepID=UPI000CF8375B|nr:uncharacterized protein LOC112141232 [Oryzias melastigma]
MSRNTDFYFYENHLEAEQDWTQVRYRRGRMRREQPYAERRGQCRINHGSPWQRRPQQQRQVGRSYASVAQRDRSPRRAVPPRPYVERRGQRSFSPWPRRPQQQRGAGRSYASVVQRNRSPRTAAPLRFQQQPSRPRSAPRRRGARTPAEHVRAPWDGHGRRPGSAARANRGSVNDRRGRAEMRIQSTDPDFTTKVRVLHRILKAAHHYSNVSEGTTPPSIAKTTQALISLIKPACPNNTTQNLLEGNAKNWECTAMLILREHYMDSADRDIWELAQFPDPDWENPFKVAVGWARKNLGRRLLEVTIREAEDFLRTNLGQYVHAPPPEDRPGLQVYRPSTEENGEASAVAAASTHQQRGIQRPPPPLCSSHKGNTMSTFLLCRSSRPLLLTTAALRQLMNNKEIVIKPADKGSVVVIMDKEKYLWEGYRQLKDEKYYKQLDKPIFLETFQTITKIFHKIYNKNLINAKQRNYLIGSSEPRARRFYLLPKIHKEPASWSIPFVTPPGRPIVSDCSSETYRSAEFIDYFLNPLSTKHQSYIKDTYDFIEKIKTLNIPHNSSLFTIDVDSLYTNIDTQEGLAAVKNIFNTFKDQKRPDEEILQLLEINLTKNDFEFNGHFFLQIKGTAMGKKFAPAYAKI